MRAWVLTVVAVLASWVYLIFGSLLAPVPVLAVGLGVWLGLRRRLVALAVLVGASPVGFSAAWAATSYALGSGRLLTIGYPPVELANVERTTRLHSVSSGCMVMQLPNNAVLAALTFLLGPMPGTYKGPYPTDAEVNEALAGGTAVALPDVSADHIRVAARDVRVRAGTGRTLAAVTSEREGPEVPIATAALWKNRVLVLRFLSPDSADERPLDALVDVASGKIIAYRGVGLDRRLPKQWTE